MQYEKSIPLDYRSYTKDRRVYRFHLYQSLLFYILSVYYYYYIMPPRFEIDNTPFIFPAIRIVLLKLLLHDTFVRVKHAMAVSHLGRVMSFFTI